MFVNTSARFLELLSSQIFNLRKNTLTNIQMRRDGQPGSDIERGWSFLKLYCALLMSALLTASQTHPLHLVMKLSCTDTTAVEEIPMDR